MRAYYGAAQAAVPADAVVCRHVIEHVPAPRELLQSIRAALAEHVGADVFFETPDVEWIRYQVLMEDFFYEHCSFFRADALAFCFRQSGFEGVSVERVFGGQYLWLHAVSRASSADGQPAPDSGSRIVAAAQRFEAREATLRATVETRLRGLRADGALAIWGAGAKGVTFLNHLDPDASLLDCVVDVNPRKQGRFVPGTGHAIIAPEALAARGVRHIIVMNPNYAAEIGEYVRLNRLPITLHTETTP